MPSVSTLLVACSLFAWASCHAVILQAQGIQNSPPSIALGVNPDLPRNCKGIAACQTDSSIIRDEEIKANIVNKCGRTQLGGGIDIAALTEDAIAEKRITSVRRGTLMQLTIHAVNPDGAGPFFCDMDEGSNTGIISQNLTVANDVPGKNGLSQGIKNQDFVITVTMPQDFSCNGGSTGDICTVRCRNSAVAGPFGGCVPVRQVDKDASINKPGNIKTAEAVDAITDQVQNTQANSEAALRANRNSPAQKLPDAEDILRGGRKGTQGKQGGARNGQQRQGTQGNGGARNGQ